MTKTYTLVYQNSANDFPVGKIVEDDDPSSGRPRMAFRYDEAWLKNGFSLGFDLPLTDAVHFPKTDKSGSENASFLFLRDQNPGLWIQSILPSIRNFGLLIAHSAPSELELLNHLNRQEGYFSCLRLIDDGNTTSKASKWPILDKKMLSDIGRASESFARNPSRMNEDELRLFWSHATLVGGKRPKFTVALQSNPDIPYVLRLRNREVDIHDTIWMEVGRELAQACELNAVEGRLVGTDAYLERRFDRDGHTPLCCLSAATLMRQKDDLSRTLPSWLNLADILNTDGASPKEDLLELFKRLVYDILVCNSRDDFEHIWFYRHSGGWKLAPLYAPLPTVPVFRLRSLPIPIAKNDTTAEPENAIAVASYFGLSNRKAKDIVLNLMRAIQNWKKLAQSAGASLREIESMQNAFYTSQQLDLL